MGQNDSTQFRREGQPAFPSDTENDNSAASSAGEETKTDDGQTSGGQSDNTQSNDSKAPLHEDPRWQEREADWNKRFNDQESRHQEDMRKIREEFGGITKKESTSSTIPAWFGGNQAQWDAYRADFQNEIKQAEDRAETRVLDRIKSETSEKDKAVQEATEYMRSEMAAIEKDTTLNPTGAKVDPNKLLKFALDNQEDCVGADGKWKWRLAWRLMNLQGGQSTSAPANTDRKKIAGATTSEGTAEKKAPTFKTGADFKKGRPW